LKKGKAFVLVSHRRWGKSTTLTSLTGGMARRIYVDGTRIVVRRMSNDEDDEGFFHLLDYTYPDAQPYVVVAMCPTFKEDRRRLPLIAALTSFSKRYDLFFFVLGRLDTKSGKRVAKHEIEAMEKFGSVEIFSRSIEADGRARAFKKFIVERM
jgi:hypothetical protein